MKRLRILFTTHGYKPAYRLGGPILSVSGLAERLAARGHEVTVFASTSNLDEDLDVQPNTPTQVDGVCVWYFRREEFLHRWLPFFPYLSKGMGYIYAPDMARELERLVPRVDLVHTHVSFIYPTYAAARAARRHGKPLLYHQRGVFDPARLRFRSVKKRMYIGMIERPILRGASTLVALTEAERASYRALGVQTRCRIVPNAIDAEPYGKMADTASTGLPIGEDTPVVLFMGRVHPTKGADRLLEAFIRSRDRLGEAVLVLAGPDEFGLEASFRRRVQLAGLQERIFFPGMVEGRRKLALLSRADVFCLPSDAEGFSMAVLEALASSTAVLLSPGCHFPEVQQAGAGLVVEPNPGSLGTALAGMLADRCGTAAMGAAGRALVLERYDWDRITDRMIEVYREALDAAEAVRA